MGAFAKFAPAQRLEAGLGDGRTAAEPNVAVQMTAGVQALHSCLASTGQPGSTPGEAQDLCRLWYRDELIGHLPGSLTLPPLLPGLCSLARQPHPP